MMLTLSFFSGALWGLANAWCLTRVVRCVVEGRRGWKLAGWVAVKGVGLYGLAAWMLIGLRLPAIPWLAGFTLSLAAVGVIARSGATKQSRFKGEIASAPAGPRND